MRETLPGQGLRDGSSVRRGRIRLGEIAAVGMGGDPAVTALIDARGKLIKAQIGEKLRSGMAAPQGSRRKWDREFESGLLQQRVRELSVPERRTDRRENNGAYANEWAKHNRRPAFDAGNSFATPSMASNRSSSPIGSRPIFPPPSFRDGMRSMDRDAGDSANSGSANHRRSVLEIVVKEVVHSGLRRIVPARWGHAIGKMLFLCFLVRPFRSTCRGHLRGIGSGLTSRARRSVAREGTARSARDPPVRYRDIYSSSCVCPEDEPTYQSVNET
jgi:hypothetical protein